MRKQVGDGTEREHVLASYAAMRRPGNNAFAVITALGAGMSTRSQAWASEGVMSKTAASRHWIEATAARIFEMRERDLRKTAFFGLMLDGVVAGNGAVVVIALGLACTGEKVVLDLEVGGSENAVVCTALVARLQRRGFAPAPGSRLFAVLDGSVALQGALLGIWPDALIQRCLVHKERNLYGYLRKGDHSEAARLWHRLRVAQGEVAGREALAQLRAFLLPLDAAASDSLAEAGDQLITLHSLIRKTSGTSASRSEVPSTVTGASSLHQASGLRLEDTREQVLGRMGEPDGEFPAGSMLFHRTNPETWAYGKRLSFENAFSRDPPFFLPLRNARRGMGVMGPAAWPGAGGVSGRFFPPRRDWT